MPHSSLRQRGHKNSAQPNWYCKRMVVNGYIYTRWTRKLNSYSQKMCYIVTSSETEIDFRTFILWIQRINLNTRTPEFLTILVLKFKHVRFPTCWGVWNGWMCSKHGRPWLDAAFCGVWSGSTLFAQAFKVINTIAGSGRSWVARLPVCVYQNFWKLQNWNIIQNQVSSDI